ncbi:hypothetical protein CR513_10348, partial [Mucuna pruriens]
MCIDEVTALIIDDFDILDCGCDITIRSCDGKLQRIHKSCTTFVPCNIVCCFHMVKMDIKNIFLFSNW